MDAASCTGEKFHYFIALYNLYFLSVSKTEILTRLFVQQFFADIVAEPGLTPADLPCWIDFQLAPVSS